MNASLLLASSSPVRARLLRNAGLRVEVMPARIDEPAMRAALAAKGAQPRDLADALAEAKALRISGRRPEALVLGCDQVLEHRGQILGRPSDRAEARRHLIRLRGERHSLLAAAVLARGGQVLWRHVGGARLTMREFSDTYLEAYMDRNWPDLSKTVGGYKLEEEGVRLFDRIEGQYFTILGLPLLELLQHLHRSGEIAG